MMSSCEKINLSAHSLLKAQNPRTPSSDCSLNVKLPRLAAGFLALLTSAGCSPVVVHSDFTGAGAGAKVDGGYIESSNVAVNDSGTLTPTVIPGNLPAQRGEDVARQSSREVIHWVKKPTKARPVRVDQAMLSVPKVSALHSKPTNTLAAFTMWSAPWQFSDHVTPVSDMRFSWFNIGCGVLPASPQAKEYSQVGAKAFEYTALSVFPEGVPWVAGVLTLLAFPLVKLIWGGFETVTNRRAMNNEPDDWDAWLGI